MAKVALGKGLGALINPRVASPTPMAEVGERVQQVALTEITPTPLQPRMEFRGERLQELIDSIRVHGIIQPLIVRKKGDGFELIAGERRWRAAQRAGLRRVPAILRDVPEELALEITLVENIQREDLNPIEQARAFERLLTEFHLTQEDVAARTGKDRATVANSLRLLKLEKPVLEAIEDGKITAGHGRALLGVGDPKLRSALASRASRGGLTVRQIERIASRRVRNAARAQDALPADPNIRAAIDELQRHLGTRVSLRPPSSKFPGQLRIEYYEDAQLSGFYEKLMK